jgi:uncharacterized protein
MAMRRMLPILLWASVLPVGLYAADNNALTEDEKAIVQSRSFLSSHPDLRYRIAGMKAYKNGDYRDAMHHFRLGAYYADKPSQAMVAEMLWNGQGTATDRVLGYVWMDLAAERLYVNFIAKREQFWNAMSETERKQALAQGEPVFAKYGDAKAKRRLEHILERDRRNITGSRTGYAGVLKIEIPGPGGLPIQINGEEFYQPQFWKPEAYWAWQNETWKALPTGKVNASDLKPVEPESKP